MTVKEEAEPLVVLVDLDGVMVDFIGGWKKIWNQKYPDRQITADPSVFLLEDAYSGIGTEEEIVGIMQTPEFFLRLDPVPGAIEAFKQMQDTGLQLYICSSPTSNSHSHKEKIDWVEMHLGKEWKNKTILTKDKTMVHGDYLIDDNPDVKGIFDPSWEHIVFESSYSHEAPKDKFSINWKTWPTLLLHYAGT